MSVFEEHLPPLWWKWQESVLRKERVSHLQSLTRGMVHDFRNGLAPVLGYVELLHSTPGLMENPDQLRFFINSLFSAACDVQQSLNHLRDFYHPVPRSLPAHSTVVCDIVDLVAENVFSKQPSRYLCELSPETRVWIKAETLQLLFQEVLENAAAAMKGPGQQIKVFSTRAGKLPSFEGQRMVWGDIPDQSWAIIFEDNGSGADESTLRYCVEPFFSGSSGRKSGVGLARVWGVMEIFDGGLVITSAPGVGTRVELHFPASYFDEHYPLPCNCDTFAHRLKGTGLSEEEQQQVEASLGQKISHVPEIQDLFLQGTDEGRSCWVSGTPFPKGLLRALDETMLSLNHKAMYVLIRAGEADLPSRSGKIRYWKNMEELVSLIQRLEF